MTGPEDWRAWVGRKETVEDAIAPDRVALMAALLDREAAPAPGEALPPGWHWLFFNPVVRHSGLGPDGHPARGGFLPPVDLPRRMYASGRLEFHGTLRVGETAERTSEIVAVEPKEGRSGRLVFVTVRHTIAGSSGTALTDEQFIVYREAGGGAPGKGEPAPAEPSWQRTLVPDPVMLFRYSAATFNGHRIHYDYPYVTAVEGYPDLIVHGPLTATLLLDLAARSAPDRRLATYTFRAKRPLFANRQLTLAGRPDGDTAKLWALDDTGALATEAEATFAAS